MSFWGFRDYVPVAQRRAKAAKEVAKLKKHGRAVSPVVIEGRKIARSFWGKAWCDNLERYSDFANRLPRGRTYVNNGSVIDLQIARGKVEALVSGSEIYKVKIDIAVAAPARWKAICADCAGSVGSHRRAPARQAFEARHGARLPRSRRPVPGAERDQDVVLLPRLGGHVQARRGDALRRRRPARP